MLEVVYKNFAIYSIVGMIPFMASNATTFQERAVLKQIENVL